MWVVPLQALVAASLSAPGHGRALLQGKDGLDGHVVLGWGRTGGVGCSNHLWDSLKMLNRQSLVQLQLPGVAADRLRSARDAVALVASLTLQALLGIAHGQRRHKTWSLMCGLI